MSAIDNDTHTMAGTGSKYHTFSKKTFGSKKEADTYFKFTGLHENTGVSQHWGTRSEHNIFRSRRGSIAGRIDNKDGTVDTWRFSSHATSRSLGSDSPRSEYLQAKKELETPSYTSSRSNETNTKPIKTNPVLSDFGRVTHARNGFTLEQATYASGVSGTGLSDEVLLMIKKRFTIPVLKQMKKEV